MDFINYKWPDNTEIVVKLKTGTFLRPVTIKKEGKKLFLKFKYNETLIEEVKCMESARWMGHDSDDPRKAWAIADSGRNRFQLQYLVHYLTSDPLNPYNKYLKPLVEYNSLVDGSGRPLYAHQTEGVRFGITKKQCIIAFEMALGKTLVAIEIMEWIHKELTKKYGWSDPGMFWIGPKSALYSVQREFPKWQAKVTPIFLTYERLKKVMEEWNPSKRPPRILICDECQRIKNPTSQRSQAVRYLSESMREEYGDDCIIVLLSGAPSPKDPADYWNLCEIVAPGFIREGNVQKFKARLALIEKQQSATGGMFPKLITWWDDSNKCKHCGQMKDAPQHDPIYIKSYHEWEPSKNEVEYLYKRMAPITIVRLKKACLDLPDKIFRIIELKPSQSILNAAKAIRAKSASTIQALTLERELSDGFQYIDTPNGTEVCPLCNGKCISEEFFDKDTPDEKVEPEEFEKGFRFNEASGAFDGKKINLSKRYISCTNCNGSGRVIHYDRATREIPTPKEEALKDILDEHDDVGRLVIYAGFQASVDRVCRIVESCGWDTIKIDGRGWYAANLNHKYGFKKPPEFLEAFDLKNKYEKIAVVAQSSSGGTGLNLQASPTILFYSNSFDGDGRMQAMERTHRPGMDIELGCTIIDLIHLPSDKLVLDNLTRKKKLSDMSMGVFLNSVKEYEKDS